VDLPFLRLLLNYKQKFHLSIHSITNVFSERNDIDRAAIVIAHRLSTIRIADPILVIEDGKSWNAAPRRPAGPRRPLQFALQTAGADLILATESRPQAAES